MHVLITGHTGFKGAWLSLLLARRGYRVSGLALDPVENALFTRAQVADVLSMDARCDIRDHAAVAATIRDSGADAIIHMAAQPLVRRSYAEPRLTFETNVMGTLAVLEGVSASPSVRGALIVTTDKVYRNVGKAVGYGEEDPLGGHDPYSASKAMADLLASSWSSSFAPCPIAIARAGNVIGGGDVSQDRLLPDLVRAFSTSGVARLRHPQAVRPWQHVLDCLNGYILLVDALVAGTGSGPWNFGPDPSSWRTVEDVAKLAARSWGEEASWTHEASPDAPHEEYLLTLDSTRTRRQLGWSDALPFDEAVEWTVALEAAVHRGASLRTLCEAQIDAFDERLA